MALSSFSDLVTELQAEFGRTDINTARVETLCLQVEADLNNNMEFRPFESLSTGTASTIAGTGTVALPAGAKWIESITLDSDVAYLEFMTAPKMDSKFLQSERDKPIYFVPIQGGAVRLAPVPDAVYTVNFIYGANVPNLAAASPTNWLMTKHPLVYLYGCAAFSALKFKDQNQATTYGGLYRDMVSGLINADKRARFTPNMPLTPFAVVNDATY
jgi:hypothetical protein